MPPKGPFFDIKKELRTGHKFPLGTFVRVWCVCVCVCMYVCVCVCLCVWHRVFCISEHPKMHDMALGLFYPIIGLFYPVSFTLY
jgi:hypothetical protein